MHLARSLVLVLLAVLARSAVAASLEDPRLQVSDVVTSGLQQITGLAWVPDGTSRLFVTEKAGTVRVVVDGVLQAAPFATESVYTGSEGGLLAVAFDPDYLHNRYVYVFVSLSSTEQAIVRYTDSGTQGTQRKVIVARLPTAGANHVGGGLGFGPDGHLYWSIGDLGNGTGVNADLTSLASKVGRAAPDGRPVTDNPFNDGVGPNNEFIWARGFRNPYTLTFHPRTGELWVNSVGTAYEQAFAVSKGSHAGYSDHEADQVAPYLSPRIVYRTNGVDRRNLAATAGAVRASGITTFTTTAPHLFQPGQRLTVSGVGDASFNGVLYVLEVASPTSFRVAQEGPDASAGGGTVETDPLGGCITGGVFYDATLFPDDYRENFLFGDFNSGNLVRAQFSDAAVSRVDAVGRGFSRNTDVTVGPDGAIYTADMQGQIRRIAPADPGDRLVLSSRHVRIVEDSEVQVALRLSRAPATDVTVQVSGSPSRFTLEAPSLTFTPEDWNQPRLLRVRVAAAPGETIEHADFLLEAPGYPTETLRAFSMERRAQALLAEPVSLLIPRGGSQEVTVRLHLRPAAKVAVSARLEGTSSLLSLVSEEALELTPSTWSTGASLVLQATSSATELAPQEDMLVLEADGLPPLRVPVSIPGQPADPVDAGVESDAGVDPQDGGLENHDAGHVPGGPQDAGTPDGGHTSDAGETGDVGGCGCSGGGAGVPFALGGLLLLLRRRRLTAG